MFSYFKNGITDTNPEKIIDLPTLIKFIKKNPEKILIEWIRVLRTNGKDEEYKKLKRTLPYITPNCMVSNRRLSGDDFDKNFQSFNQYIYFDIDIPGEEYKQSIITKYGHQVAMVCMSSSGGGISILFKVSNSITKDNFDSIWQTIRTTILKDEPVDEKCKDIGRCMFISYDPEVYVNYDNEITVEEVKQSIIYNDVYNNRLTYSFSEKKDKPVSDKNKKKVVYKYTALNIDEVLSKLITSTRVNVTNPIVDFYPVDYAEVFFKKVIVDGTKRKCYSSMIHQLLYLNPDIDKLYIYSYLFYINNNFGKPKMLDMELVKLFDFVYDTIKSTGVVRARTKVKYVHFNKFHRLTQNEKKRISNLLNGHNRRYKTINKIIAAKQELTTAGTNITQKQVSQLSGLSLKTVQIHFNSEPIDMDLVIQRMNNPATKILKDLPTGMGLKNRKTKFDTITQPEEYIHPDCPQWVLDLGKQQSGLFPFEDYIS